MSNIFFIARHMPFYSFVAIINCISGNIFVLQLF